MAETAELLRPAEIEYNRETRHYDDTTTWLAEVLDGQMRTSFDYTFDGQELYGRDGSPLKPIFKTAIEDAKRRALDNPKLAFEVRRRYLEDGELKEMYAMARGDRPNTMVVVSDSPVELRDATEDIAGYNVRRKQTMLRVITRGEDGKIRMRSQSLDRSDRESLEALYHYLGFEPKPGELLGQRMQLELPGPEEQEFLIDWLTGVYDRSLASLYGGEWYGGRTPAEMLNTYDFVREQEDLINTFVQQKLQTPNSAEELRYGLAAAMEARFKTRFHTREFKLVTGALGHKDVLQEINGAGNQARLLGKIYSGCGVTLTSAQDELSELGFGKKIEQDEFGPLEFKCQKGHINTRPRHKLIENCKTCGISVKC